MAPEQSQNINNTFFKGFYKEVWRKMIPEGLTEAEADFIENVASLSAGHRMLDIMCGYGRHSIALAKRTLAVTALDNLQDYITEIEGTVREQNLSIVPICGDVVTVELEGWYQAAICMGNSFSFFNHSNALTVLKSISAHLHTGGKLIINTWMISEIITREFREKEWHYVEDYRYLVDSRFLFSPTRIESEHIIIAPDGETEKIKGVDYIFSLSELEAMFGAAGFRLAEVYSTPRKRKFKLGDKTAYIIAEKVA